MGSRPVRISVIIPAYNVEPYIAPALDSLFAQAVPIHEVIIVNDGSTDDTAREIEKYAQRPEVTVVTTPNQGLGPARNEGLDRATGDYVYFFDSDDLLREDFLCRMHAEIQANQHPDLIMFSGQSFVHGNPDQRVGNDLRRPFTETFADGGSAVARLVRAGTPAPCAWLYLSRRTLWESNGLRFKNIVHEDDDMFLPLLMACGRVVVLEDVFYERRLREHSITTSGKSVKNARGLLVAAGTLSRLYGDSAGQPEATRRAIRKRAVRTTRRYLRVCRKIGVRPDTRKVMDYSVMLRSPSLAMAAAASALVCSLRPTLRARES
ncbi:MAG TPA: glycosyltransferase [Oleiagrimonas sp.]|nr:glycosyltransferase [Oleiagrimonas sp.]